MSEVFRCIQIEEEEKSPDSSTERLRSPKSEEKKKQEESYIPVREINLDDNGLKDPSFACILAAIAT